jgi:hypothetical protein
MTRHTFSYGDIQILKFVQPSLVIIGYLGQQWIRLSGKKFGPLKHKATSLILVS